MADIRLLSNVDENATSPRRFRVASAGGVNVYAVYQSLGGGTLNIYECPDETIRPNLPVYTSVSGEPVHLNVTPGSFLLGELVGATNPQGVTLGVRTMSLDNV